MDRQNVEYIERTDDEEFDEFGRKKKKRRLDETAFVCFSIYFCEYLNVLHFLNFNYLINYRK